MKLDADTINERLRSKYSISTDIDLTSDLNALLPLLSKNSEWCFKSLAPGEWLVKWDYGQQQTRAKTLPMAIALALLEVK